MDPHRLPRRVLPIRYDLRLEPDLATSMFVGEEIVTVSVHEPTAEIIVNAAELEILSASVEGQSSGPLQGQIELDEPLERCRMVFPGLLTPGVWRLQVSFRGKLNDKLRGFYRSSYKDPTGRTCLLAATQFEATDARRAFPCWDEPDFKAVFSTILVIDSAMTAVSNTAVKGESQEGEKKVVRFTDTIPMSSYLVAFVVGELEATEPVVVGQTPLRVWSVPGKRHLAAFGQDIAAFSLRFFEDYYGLPYPGDKLDLLAIPDFASGAMENLGAITFRETALLVDEQAATHGELERVADVVAHENAHMWFGDLVTMSWWNGLWLNEAFATFMEMLAVDVWKPEWRRWTTFGVSRAAALAVDGLHSTRPIEYPVYAPADADAMFDVLTYEKGASVLRMLEQHLGPLVFRDGVREYLRAHAHGNADTHDLWAALGHTAGLPVPEIMNDWIFTPGFPLLSVRLDRQPGEGTSLVVTQQRFQYLRESEIQTQKSSDTHPLWQIPVQLRIKTNGKSETRRVLLRQPEIRLDLKDGAESIVVNEGGHGFYRVQYDPELLKRLLEPLPSELAPIERFNLVNDAWALTMAGQMPLNEYLDLTSRFRHERDKNVWAVLLESFLTLFRLVPPGDRQNLEAFVRGRVGPALAELGWVPDPSEDDLMRQLRGELLRALGTIGNDAGVQARAAEVYAEYRRDVTAGKESRTRAVDPNVVPALVGILAHIGDAVRYNEFYELYRTATTPQDERRYLFALAAFQPVTLLDQTLLRTIDGAMRSQDAPFVVRLLLMSVYGRERAWTFVKEHWDRMDAAFPKNGLRRMCDGVTGLVTPELERDVREFFSSRKIDLGGKILEQYLEQLRVLVRFREQQGITLSRYLASGSSH